MNWLGKLVLGPIAPYLAGGVALALAGSGLAIGVQSWRLNHAKAQLVEARAALVNPATDHAWSADYAAAAKALLAKSRDLDTCHSNADRTAAALEVQNSALEAQAARDAQSLAKARQALQAADSAAARALALADDLARPIAANETCAAMLEIDARFLKGRL